MYKKTNKTHTVQEIVTLLEKYCVYQDRCHQEIEKKISIYTNVQDVKDSVIMHLIEHNYLNEERFAKNYVRGKFNQNHWGRNKIKLYLQSKNISTYNIATGLKEIEADIYLAALEKEMIKKEKFVKENNPFLKKKKVVSYLINKGFEFENINPMYKKLFNF